ncbi:hypothetical protein C9J01_06870 [Photobacterium rosenbergii]|uniref:Inositol monophosphatase n=1 Tax=Photobacterium rosenbergii TaxID=294936 RepID=A0A2T3NMJ4_9GAMM|nr:inositol monophosphatase [Photobacterium rosenbergii]PSW16710.1 hypothetical protein C9J01_06870 [Photobacterium rosenbergii]
MNNIPAIIDDVLHVIKKCSRQTILSGLSASSNVEKNQKKSASDIATQDDREIEKQLRQSLSHIFPTALIIGEESVYESPELLSQAEAASLSIIIDPIDGTWHYAHGSNLVGVMIAILKNGRCIFGVIYDPLNDEFIYAVEGEGAFVRTKDNVTKSVAISANSPNIGLCSPFHFNDAKIREVISSWMNNYDRVFSLSCSSFEYKMILNGGASFYLTHESPKPWDHLAGVLIVNEAGGYAAKIDNTEYLLSDKDNNLLVCSSEKIWQQIVTQLPL